MFMRISKGCSKGLLIALNMLFVFIAVGMFCCATVDIKILTDYGDEQAGASSTCDVVIIVLSILLVALSLFGCLGTMRENERILYTYVMFLAALLVMEVVITIFVSIQRIGLQYRVTDWLRDDFFRNVTNDAKAHDQLWDNLQHNYQCCGLNGPDDYAVLGLPISLSCCYRAHVARSDMARMSMYQNCIESKSYYNFGCEDDILLVIKSDGQWLLGIAVTGFWLEAEGILLALLVANHIKYSVHSYKHTVKY